MTATAVRGPISEPADQETVEPSLGVPFTGTGALIRFVLRRDRVKLPAWLLGITLLSSFFATVLSEVAATEEQRQDLSRFMQGGLGAVFGPGYGRDAVTPELYLVGVYGLFFFVLAALMCMLLVSRHTRVDEQHGRTELIRSGGVGRHAQLAAVLTVAAGANVVLALLLGGAMAANGYGSADGLLFGASVGAVGLVFAGLTALTAQVTQHSRAATGIAGAALGAAWAVRASGDVIRDHGSALSWLSPLAWSNQTRPYVDARWWPLLLSVGVAAAFASAAVALSTRRDLGEGLVPARPGRPVAASWLRSPLAVAVRLQRTSLIWWTAALAAFGFVFGGLADQVADADTISESRVEMFGGSLDTLVDGYLGVIALLIAALAGIAAVLGVQSMRAEETSGRAEPVLATATSRRAWFGSHLVVLAVGVVGLLLVVGFATGIGSAISAGDGAYVRDMTLAHAAHAPGVLLLLAMAALALGVLPRAIGIVWAVLGYSLFTAIFGVLLDHPRWLRNLSPMEHTGQPPLDRIPLPAAIILLVSATLLVVVGLAAFSRRDLETA
jgi:ABC-2 type transport system permease protein